VGRHQHDRAGRFAVALDVAAQRQAVEVAARAEFDVQEHVVVGALREQFDGTAAAQRAVHQQAPTLQARFQEAQREFAVVHQQGGRRRLLGRRGGLWRRALAPVCAGPTGPGLDRAAFARGLRLGDERIQFAQQVARIQRPVDDTRRTQRRRRAHPQRDGQPLGGQHQLDRGRVLGIGDDEIGVVEDGRQLVARRAVGWQQTQAGRDGVALGVGQADEGHKVGSGHGWGVG
jgi:hypothetical protein